MNVKIKQNKREGHYIRQYNCVNERIAGRTQKEYRQENKEAIKEYDKEYYQQNKEAKAEYYKVYGKKYREENKEARKKKAEEKITCECGSVYRRDVKAKHLKTKKHLKFVEFKNKNTINS
jgi:hypothetical protein